MKMNYDTDFWNNYTQNNDAGKDEGFIKFIHDLATSLRAQSVLEIGCNTGNILGGFSDGFEVHGIDLNENALEIARKKFPTFKFQNASTTALPYDDSLIDFIFTFRVFNYIDESDMKKSLDEMFRVARKYIVNCELLVDDGEKIRDSNNSWYRDMYKRWQDYKVRIVSNVEMHEDYDPEKGRFVLVKKLPT